MMKIYRILLALGATALLATAGFAATPGDRATGIENAQQNSEYRLPVTSAKGLATAIAAQERHSDELMQRPGIHGTAVGVAADGSAVVKIFADPAASVAGLPDNLDDVPVVIERMAPVFALNVDCETRGIENCDAVAAAGTEPPSQISWQPRPVPIGVSTGHIDVTAGTLGCRVSQGCHKYALSNAHVYANENDGVVGDPVLQPGTFDGGTNPADVIGTLYDSVPIVMGTSTTVRNKVDAAIVATDASKVAMVTRSNGYGQPQTTTVNPQVGLLVQKYGRTTALTHGYIDSINAIINVGYRAGTARFISQIVIKSTNVSVPFSIVGDSGSLIVIDGGTNSRKPVGLLFASTSDNVYTIANPINEVLTALDITIDGD
jgi:hypothetical protein